MIFQLFVKAELVEENRFNYVDFSGFVEQSRDEKLSHHYPILVQTRTCKEEQREHKMVNSKVESHLISSFDEMKCDATFELLNCE